MHSGNSGIKRVWSNSKKGKVLSMYKASRLLLCSMAGLSFHLTCARSCHADQLTLNATAGTLEDYNGQYEQGDGVTLGELYNLETIEPYAFFRNEYDLNLDNIPPGQIIASITFQLWGVIFDSLSGDYGPYDLTMIDTSQLPDPLDPDFDSLAGVALLGSGDFAPAPPPNSLGVSDLTLTGNSDFVSLLNANLGGEVIVGGTGNTPYGSADGPISFTVTTVAVPEPSAVAFLWIGVAGALIFLPRIRNQRSVNVQQRHHA